jgi:DNA replication protein DnaC
MNRIGQDGHDFEERFRRMREEANRVRQQRVQEHGWSVDCDCNWCGDTGINPDYGAVCICGIGEERQIVHDRTESWPDKIPAGYRDCRFDTSPNKDLCSQVIEWLAADPIGTGCNLLINGSTGVGKTGAAVAALHALHMAGRSVAYCSTPTLFQLLRREAGGDTLAREAFGSRAVPVMDQLIKADCILLDDIGQERDTEFAAEQLYVLIEGRTASVRPTIVTTNLRRAELARHIGERNASRLRKCHKAVSAMGRDYRSPDVPLRMVRDA